MPGDEDYSKNLPALGRFKPGYVAGAEGSTGELDVTLTTNLAGEPIRFTMNESLDNIVSSATLTMLNATIGDGGIQYDGVMGEEHTEEDEAQWGTLYNSAPVEPNQLVTVTEAGGGLGTCTTYWRVVGVTAYLDENDVPYYEVQLEGMGQVAIDTKFDPSMLVTDTKQAYFVQYKYYMDMLDAFQIDKNNDGYVSADEATEASESNPVVSTITAGARYIVPEKIAWLSPFLYQLSQNGLDCGAVSDGTDLVPLECTYKAGESCWQIISDILGLNGKMARFTRDKRMIVIDLLEGSWSYMPRNMTWEGNPVYDQTDLDNPPLPDTNIGNFGRGIQLSYSKEGVYSQALVSGFLGQDNGDGAWIVDAKQPIETVVTSEAGKNILNGEVVELAVQVDERYKLESEDALKNYGQKELYKTVIGARSATYDSESVPLNVEVGMTVNGSSKLGGTTAIFITALNRTTDAQQNKISTGISGTRVLEGGGDSNDMGWS
jgi:hypothetical protein